MTAIALDLETGRDMHIDLIEGQQRLVELRANWDAVYDADPEAQFFLSWPWMSKWLGTLSHPWFVLGAKLRANASDYVAFLPLRLRTKELKRGDDHRFYNALNLAGNYASDYTGFICAPQFEDKALPALARRLKQMNWARFHLEYFRASPQRTRLFLDPFMHDRFALTQSSRINPDKVNNLVCPAVALPIDWDGYLATLSANTRQKIRRHLRTLEASSDLRITLSTAETAEHDVKTLLHFWASQWGARKGNRLRGILQTNLTMLTHCLRAGMLFMPVLWNRDTPVAVLATFIDRQKKSLLFYMGGRDASFDDPPPGFVLHAYSLRFAVTNGFMTYDFLRGDEAYKYSFGAKDRLIACIDVTTSNGRNLGDRLDRRSLPIVLSRAEELHQQGKLVEAEHGYQQVLDVAPANTGALYGLGKLAATRGDHRTAVRLFKAVLSAGTDSYKVWFRLAKSLQAREMTRAAADAYREVIRRAPDYAPAHASLGMVLCHLERFDEALSAYEAAMALNPDDVNIRRSWTDARKAVAS
jgi:tetratricopeptide (TPR) repeat protein